MDSKTPTVADGGPDTDAGDEPTAHRGATYTTESTYKKQLCIDCGARFDPDPPYKGYYCKDCR